MGTAIWGDRQNGDTIKKTLSDRINYVLLLQLIVLTCCSPYVCECLCVRPCLRKRVSFAQLYSFC